MPKKTTESGRLFAYLMEEKDLDKMVEAAIKVLMHDDDQVSSDDASEDKDAEEFELVDNTNEDDSKEDDDLTVFTVENDPQSLRDRILDQYLKVKETGEGWTKLRKLLYEVVEKTADFGSDKDYFALPSRGDFDFTPEHNEEVRENLIAERGEFAGEVAYKQYLDGEAAKLHAEWNDLRYSDIQNGYSDSSNYEFLDLDIETYQNPEERETVRLIEVMAQNLTDLEAEKARKAYKANYEAWELYQEGHDRTSRAAYYNVVTQLYPGKFDQVAKALATA
jgi:hypothetical protein